MVPKAITLALVNHSKENLQRELLQELYKPEVLDDLLKESEFVVNRRKEVTSMLQALNKAEECVSPFLPSFLLYFFLSLVPASRVPSSAVLPAFFTLTSASLRSLASPSLPFLSLICDTLTADTDTLPPPPGS